MASVYQITKSPYEIRNSKVLKKLPPAAAGTGARVAEGWLGGQLSRRFIGSAETGKTLRTIDSNRFVSRCHAGRWLTVNATWENDESELRRIDARTGEVLDSIAMAAGANVSGLESNGGDQFYCGGGKSGKIRAFAAAQRRGMNSGAASGGPRT